MAWNPSGSFTNWKIDPKSTLLSKRAAFVYLELNLSMVFKSVHIIFLSIERSEKNNVWSSFDISFFFKCASDIYSSSQQKNWTFWRLSLLFAQTYSSVFFHISHAFIEERSNDDFSEKRKNCSDQIFKPLLRCLWLRKTVTSNCKMFLGKF